jgi:hypothetical protein
MFLYDVICFVLGGQKTKFKSASIKVEQTGRAILTVIPDSNSGLSDPEEYFITLPELVLRGLLTGQLFVELAGKSAITSSTGYQATIDYLPKPWIGGTYHSFKGTIVSLKHDGSTDNLSNSSENSNSKKRKTKKSSDELCDASLLYTIEGKWTTISHVTDSNSGETKVLFDADAHPRLEPQTRPLEEQDDMESRKLWKKVAEAISAGNYAEATQLKTTIEDYQRTQRKLRTDAGQSWMPKYFIFISDESASSKSRSSAGTLTLENVNQERSPIEFSRTSIRSMSVFASGEAFSQLSDNGLWTYAQNGPSN